MIGQIFDKDEKRTIARKVLEALKDWFEVDESREQYIRESADRIFIAAKENNEYIGFLCLKETGRDTVELAVMGVLMEYHRSGIDTAGKAATASLVAAGLDAVFIIMWEEWMAFGHRIICSCYRLQNYKKKVIIVLILIIF